MKIFRTRDVSMPLRAHSTDAGMDIFIPNKGSFFIKDGTDLLPIDESVELKPGMSVLIPSGIKANVPNNRALIAFNKSGVASKKSLVIGACVIDEPYQGEIHIDIKNVGNSTQTITAGDKITQLLCIPVDYVEIEESLSEEECFGNVVSERGAAGFGSTGTKAK